jgi:hypothetical protein
MVESKKVNWLANKSLQKIAIVALVLLLLCMAVPLVNG